MSTSQSSPVQPHPPGLNPVMERNIRVLLERKGQDEQRRSFSERLADRVTRFAGSMAFVYLHVLIFGWWILQNTGLMPLPRFDPSLVILAMLASVEAIFLSTFVLISQNRMAAAAEKRAELDLQISLLAEHEVTRLITMVSTLMQHTGSAEPQAEEIAELKKDIAPEKVLDRIEGR